MTIVRVSNRTYVLKTPTQLIPFYALLGNKVILIDCGHNGEKKSIMSALAEKRLTVVAVLVTHAHVDHIGNASFLQKIYSSKIVMSRIEASRCSSAMLLKCNYMFLTESDINKYYRNMITEANEYFPDNKGNFTILGSDFRIIESPGHTPGHVSIVTPDNVVCLGDALLSESVIDRINIPYSYNVLRDIETTGFLYYRHIRQSILTEGYKIEHSELLMSYINRTSESVEIEACGYLGDLAFFKVTIIEDSYNQAEDSEIAKKIHLAALSYKDRLSNNIELSENYQNMIKRYIGDSYKNLSIQSECILESAIRQFENSRKIINYDYAGISMKLCKVYERELKSQLFDKWKKEASVSFDKKSLKPFLIQAEINKDRNLINLLKFLLGDSKIELGPMRFIIDRVKNNCNHEVLESLKEYILRLNNDKYLLSEDFMEHCNKISSRYRNGGVHEKIVSYDICKEAFDNILKNERCYLGLLLDL